MCLFVAFILINAILLLQVPAIQLKLVGKATTYLSKILGFPLKVEGLHIAWLDEIVLEGVSVRDRKNGKMIYLREANVDFLVRSLLHAKIEIQEVSLIDGSVNLIKDKNGSLNIDEFITAIRKLAPQKTRKTTNPTPFMIASVKLRNMQFSFNDTRKPRIKYFDHNHFTLDSIYADVANLTAIRDTFKIDIRNLSTFEKSTYLKVHKINTDYLMCDKSMDLVNLYAHIGDSYVRDQLKFNFSRLSELSSFVDKVTVVTHLDSTIIALGDLALFAPDLMAYTDKALISGDFKGKVGNFGVKNLFFAFGQGSYIKGALKLNGLPFLEETLIEFTYDKLKIDTKDLKQYTGPRSFEVLRKFGTIAGHGKFTGFPNDFVTHGTLNTQIGALITDINLKIDPNKNPQSYYKGHLKTTHFNFGKLIDKQHLFGLVDLDGEIEGNGFNLADADVRLNATISRLGINSYDYKNIRTNAQLTQRMFNGELTVNDPNLAFDVIGKVDLREGKNIFDISAKLDRAQLKPLHLTFGGHDILAQTDLKLNFKGLKLDDLEGEASFANTYVIYNNEKEIYLDSLVIQSHQQTGHRKFSLESDLISAYAEGNFQFTSFVEDIKRNIKEYQLNFENNSTHIHEYYRALRTAKKNKYNIEFNLIAHDVNPLLDIFLPDLFVSKGVFVTGDYTSGYTNIFNFHTNIDTLHYKQNEILKTEIEFSSSKVSDSVNTLAMLYISSEAQRIVSAPPTRNFYFEGVWNNRTIDFETRAFQQGSNNSASLMGVYSFLKDKESLALRNSQLTILDQVWNIAENNKIIFAKQEISFDNFSIFNGNQSLAIDGTISGDKTKESILTIDNFNMENINPILTSAKFEGLVTATVVIKDLYKDLDLEGNLLVHGFKVDNFLIGNVNGFAEYNNFAKRLDVNVGVERLGTQVIQIIGNVKANETTKEEDVNLTAALNNANLEALNPILSSVLKDISGSVTGNFTIKGTLKKVLLRGTGDVHNGKFTIGYLGTTYFFDDKIYLNENVIGFSKLVLKDFNGNQAVVDGGFYHEGFKNFVVDMSAALRNLNVLNTSETDNTSFYGIANVTGNVRLSGPFSDLKIVANATSNRGTKIYIPLNSTASLEQQSFIKFKKFGDVSEGEKTNLDLSGIDLEFNLDITPDAYAEIIFDKRSGDIIRGNGYGNIKLKIDTRGEFSMFGQYSLTEGYYNFTLAGLINKEFKIKPNSTISWSGDPYTGQLDMEATYAQFASLAPIIDQNLDSAKAADPEFRRKYPTNVLLSLTGNLLAPTIGLGIDIVKYPPKLSGEVLAFQSSLKTNEYELNRQVFSLLVLGVLSSQNSFTGVGSSANNLSELLSNQLSNWLSQVDDNLEIDINLNSLSLDALNTFQLRMTYTLMDGRLRITRENAVQSVQNNQTNLTNIAGEWTVEYLLSKEGNLRLKLYNRANQSILLTNGNNNANTTSAGFSILHTQSFSNLMDLFRRKKEAEIEDPASENDHPVTDTYLKEGPLNFAPSTQKDINF